MACAGFILAGAEFFLGGAESRPKGAKKNSAPPAEFDSAPEEEQTRGGAENLIIPRERGKNFNDSSHQFFDYTITFVN